ncbi:unnamed protein product [Moneuplotes crassus]|uniref:Uncharacterized protein n=1 Tax=Euplotes crassus TaxID=5936 RepID=A0AAD1XXW6_EUPCR|nr:unnamed protein product [Moneuplotes crassus]
MLAKVGLATLEALPRGLTLEIASCHSSAPILRSTCKTGRSGNFCFLESSSDFFMKIIWLVFFISKLDIFSSLSFNPVILCIRLSLLISDFSDFSNFPIRTFKTSHDLTKYKAGGYSF